MITLARASLILDAIAEARRPLSISDLAAQLGLPRSSVHRVLQELEAELYVVRAAGERGYLLGPGLLKFGMNSHLRLLAANRASLAALAREVNENVDLAVFSGREVVVVDQIGSPARLKSVTKIGKSFSLHASCIGKALLALLPDDQVEALVPPRLHAFTPATITDRAELLAGLPRIARTGIAVDLGEHDAGISAAATGFIGPTGARQAVAVVVPSHVLTAKWELIITSLARLNPRVAVEELLTHPGI
ncbi:MAG: IclR family transcriptional regulator [Nocardioides sp.]|uniref:IclR family transcriptional regulator n=1 Tax=Nocardioides sp. TaxID=35761 RepID=UPI0039E570BF